VSLRGVIAACRVAVDDVAREADMLTALRGDWPGDTTRAEVRQRALTLRCLLVGAEQLAAWEGEAILPAGVSCDAHAARRHGLKEIGRILAGVRAQLEKLVQETDARRFKPRARRLRVCGLIARMGWQLGDADRSAAQLGGLDTPAPAIAPAAPA
jgi:hypothetical protein